MCPHSIHLGSCTPEGHVLHGLMSSFPTLQIKVISILQPPVGVQYKNEERAGGQRQGYPWLKFGEGGPVGVQAAAVCKRNNVSIPTGRQEWGMQSHCSCTSQRSASSHVL